MRLACAEPYGFALITTGSPGTPTAAPARTVLVPYRIAACCSIDARPADSALSLPRRGTPSGYPVTLNENSPGDVRKPYVAPV
jgi:hypothetical protein